MIRQIVLTLLVALVVFAVVQWRRRAARIAEEDTARGRYNPQAIAGWVLLAVMLGAAVGAAFLHSG